MAKNRAEKNRKLVFAEEDSTTEQPNDSNTTFDPKRARKGTVLPDGRVLKPNGRAYTPGSGNPSHAHIPQEDRCTARRATDGKPCTKLRVAGAEVCGTHGGRAPQVMRKAMARLQNASDRMVQQLLAIAMDDEEPPPVRLAAIKEALDRAGIKSTEKVDIAHSMKPWEQVMAGAVRIERTAPAENDVDPTIKALQQNDDRY